MCGVFVPEEGNAKRNFDTPPPNGPHLQSGASSPAKHGGAYFSAVYGFIQDPIAAPGPYENQEP